jgi:regulator of replication initiation timing
MFDIISDLDNDDHVNIPSYHYDLPENNYSVNTLPSSLPQPSSNVGTLPVNNQLVPSSPESEEMPTDESYMIYENNYYGDYNNNIGYSYDATTGTYIPVTVTVGDNNVEYNMVYDPNMVYNNFGYTGSVAKDENKRPRKRKRTGTVQLPSPNELTNAKDYEDALIALDSQSFDEYVEGAYRFKKYTEEEKEFFRDIRRRIKNRESARKSRMNKRTKLDTLSVQVQDLNDQTSILIQENEQLKIENYQLKNEVFYLKNIIHANNYQVNNIPVKEETTKSSSPIGSHSIFLFVLLFSFGILWNLDVSIFSSPLLQNAKPQFFSSAPPKAYVDPVFDKLLDNINEDIQENKQDTQRIHNLKKDVELCCF